MALPPSLAQSYNYLNDRAGRSQLEWPADNLHRRLTTVGRTVAYWTHVPALGRISPLSNTVAGRSEQKLFQYGSGWLAALSSVRRPFILGGWIEPWTSHSEKSSLWMSSTLNSGREFFPRL